MGKKKSPIGVEPSGECQFLFRIQCWVRSPMVHSMVRSSHKGAENKNKLQRKEQYKMITKDSHRSLGSCRRGQELHMLGWLEEAPCHCEREPHQVPRPVSACLPCTLDPSQSPWESCHCCPYYKRQHSGVAVCLYLGRILTSSKYPGAWNTSFHITNNLSKWIHLLLN